MDWGKVVKKRGGAQHRTVRAARFLDTIDAPFLKTTLSDGSVARKKGQDLFADGGDEPEASSDGYFVLGKVGTEYRVMGSGDARGRFSDRGLAGVQGAVIPTLRYYGGGYGMTTSNEVRSTGFYNFDGKAYPLIDVKVSVTRSGRTMKLRHTFTSTKVQGGVNPALYTTTAIPFYMWSGTLLIDGEHTRRNYYVGLETWEQQHVPVIYADPADGTPASVISTPFLPNQLSATPSLQVMDTRGSLLVMTPVMRPTYTGSSVNVAECPGLVFTRSTDHGVTWDAASVSLFDDSQSLLNIPIGAGSSSIWNNATTFNNAVFEADLQLFCTDPVACKGIALAVVPVAYNNAGMWVVKYLRKIGKYSGGTFIESVVLGQSHDPASAYEIADSPIPYTIGGVQGVLFLDRRGAEPPALTGFTVGSAHPMLRWTDGETVLTGSMMPLPNYQTGGLTALDMKSVVCPIYDGQFSLYRTKDGGGSWVRRAMIHSGAGATAPTPTDASMRNFYRLAFLRKGSTPAGASPSAPWMTDSRRLPPQT